MVDATGMTNELTNAAAEEQAKTLESLEYRVQRLEDALAAFHDTRLMEERVAERVSMRLNRPIPSGPRDKATVIVDAGRRLLPYTLDTVQTAADPAKDEGPMPRSAARPAWLPVEAYHEALAMVRMYLDPHYRVSWAARLIPLLMLVAIATSWVWLPGTAVLPEMVTAIYVKVVDLMLAFLLFKFMQREARRFLHFEASRYRPV